MTDAARFARGSEEREDMQELLNLDPHNVYECDLQNLGRALFAAIDDRDALLAQLREELKMERELMRSDVIFYGTDHQLHATETFAEHRCGADGRECPPVRCVLLNDTFGFACADAENVSDEELPIVFDAWKRWNHHGVTAWAALRRGIEPLDSLRTEQYLAARAALAAAAQARKGETK